MNRLKRMRKIKKRVINDEENVTGKGKKLEKSEGGGGGGGDVVETDNLSFSYFEPEIKIESGNIANASSNNKIGRAHV